MGNGYVFVPRKSGGSGGLTSFGSGKRAVIVSTDTYRAEEITPVCPFGGSASGLFGGVQLRTVEPVNGSKPVLRMDFGRQVECVGRQIKLLGLKASDWADLRVCVYAEAPFYETDVPYFIKTFEVSQNPTDYSVVLPEPGRVEVLELFITPRGGDLEFVQLAGMEWVFANAGDYLICGTVNMPLRREWSSLTIQPGTRMKPYTNCAYVDIKVQQTARIDGILEADGKAPWQTPPGWDVPFPEVWVPLKSAASWTLPSGAQTVIPSGNASYCRLQVSGSNGGNGGKVGDDQGGGGSAGNRFGGGHGGGGRGSRAIVDSGLTTISTYATAQPGGSVVPTATASTVAPSLSLVETSYPAVNKTYGDSPFGAGGLGGSMNNSTLKTTARGAPGGNGPGGGGGNGGYYTSTANHNSYNAAAENQAEHGAAFGGGLLILSASKVVIGSSGMISANGGSGGKGGNRLMTQSSAYYFGSAGGGGGGGGVVLLLHRGLENQGTICANGGLGGENGYNTTKTATHIPTSGSAGALGTVLELRL